MTMVSIKARVRIALVASAMAITPAVHAAPAVTNVAAAIADPGRPAEDRALDESRHPADILKLLNLRPGETIADIWPGDYWDRLFSDAVGPRGTVYAVHLPVADKAEKVATPADGSTPVAGHANVIAVSTAPTEMVLPKKADVIWIRQNYHDLYDPFMGPVDVRRSTRLSTARSSPVAGSSSSTTSRPKARSWPRPIRRTGSTLP